MKRCFYPNCVLEEHETGDHKFGRPEKPWGTLRLIQTFQYANFRCETCPPFKGGGLKGFPIHAAIAFYADMLGFGWALCADCAKTFSTTEVTEEHGERLAEPSPRLVLPASASSVSSVVNPPPKVLKFARRNA